MSEKSEKGYKNDEILRLSVPVCEHSIFNIFLGWFLIWCTRKMPY